MLVQEVTVVPQLELVDFGTEIKVDFGLYYPSSYLLWLHSPVIPVDLHLRVFSARWAANN